jgi:hypothetical protein
MTDDAAVLRRYCDERPSLPHALRNLVGLGENMTDALHTHQDGAGIG